MNALAQFEPNASDTDAEADKEAFLLAAGFDLERAGKAKDFGRDQRFKDNVNFAVLVVFWMVVGGIAWGVVAYGWHLLMPENWHYLAKPQLERVEAILGAAILSSALTGYASKRL